MAAGVGILAMPRHRAEWLWFRVFGDVLDVATVLYALFVLNGPVWNNVIAIVLLLPIGALDVWCARALTDQRRMARDSHAYDDRSGLARRVD